MQNKLYLSIRRSKSKKNMKFSKEMKNKIKKGEKNQENNENIQKTKNALKEALNINEEVNIFFIIFNIVKR